jgi:hypothetical protein
MKLIIRFNQMATMNSLKEIKFWCGEMKPTQPTTEITETKGLLELGTYDLCG